MSIFLVPKQNKSVLIIFKILILKLFKTSRKTFRRKLLFIFIPMGFSQKKETLLTDCRAGGTGGGGFKEVNSFPPPHFGWITFKTYCI